MTTFNKEKVKAELVKSLEVAMCKLHRIWSEIGICESQRQERSNTVMIHLRNLLDEMVQEEDALKNAIMGRIEKYNKDVLTLCEELGKSEYKPKNNLSMLQLEKDLRAQGEILVKEKQERLRVLQVFKDQDQALCDMMCLTPYYIPSGTTPSSEQLQALENHVASLKAEKVKRFSEFVNLKKKIMELFQEMDRTPQSDFEREIVCEKDDTFQLSEENLCSLRLLHTELGEHMEDIRQEVNNLWDRVHVLWDRLTTPDSERTAFTECKEGFKPKVISALKEEVNRCEKLKFENMQKFVKGMRKELVQWWDKCYFGKQQRLAFTHFNDNEYTEELLELHDQEVARMKSHYETYREMYENVNKWTTLFKQMQEMERKANDPNRFNNRGGSLLQEEKARKKVLKELPKVEEEIRDTIIEWEKQHNTQFLVEGDRFIDYIEKQWNYFHESKVREKEMRNKAKAKLMEEEMTFGSKPSTPIKRRFIGTPSKTPNKVRKLNEGGVSLHVRVNMKINESKTPASCSRLQQNSVFQSPYRKAPMSTSKLTPASKSLRRRSNRLARKVLSEKTNNQTTFSHTTVSSCGQQSEQLDNNTLASMGDYQEFEREIRSRPYFSRSSMLVPPSPGKK